VAAAREALSKFAISTGTKIRSTSYAYLDDIDVTVFSGVPDSVQSTDAGVLLRHLSQPRDQL